MLKNLTFNNEGFKKMIEKFNKVKDKNVKTINGEMKNYIKNIYKSYQEKSDRANLYSIARMIEEATGISLIENSNIEDELFDNIFSKVNKTTLKDLVQNKYNTRKNNSSKYEINNG